MSVLVVAQSSSEIPEGLMNNPVYKTVKFSNKIDDITVHSRRRQNHVEVMKTGGQSEQRTL